MTIGQAARQARRSQEWSQDYVGKLLGVSRQTVISIEKGTSLPGFALAKKMSHTLGICLDSVTA